MVAGVPRLTSLLAPVVSATGHDLEELSVSPAGRRRVVRVLVDKEGGTSLDDIADVSRALSEALDDIDAREPSLLAGAYVLEVSSPGVDRPLTEPRHWRRNLGRLVTAALRDGASVTGRLTAADDRQVQIGDRQVAYGEVVRGQVQVEFTRPGAADGLLDEEADDETADDEPADDEPDEAAAT